MFIYIYVVILLMSLISIKFFVFSILVLFIYIFYFCYLFPIYFFFFFQAEDGIRDATVTGVQTCALPICSPSYRDRHEARRLCVLYPAVADTESLELGDVRRPLLPRPRIARGQAHARAGARLYRSIRESSHSLRATSGSHLPKGWTVSSWRTRGIACEPPPLPRSLGPDDWARARAHGARIDTL